MNANIQNRLRSAKRRVERRLDGASEDRGKPMFQTANLHVELADKVRAIGTGGIGLVHRLAEQTGLVDAINRRLHLLKIHRPYHESDHVLNLAYNAMCDGVRLEDIELRRNDEVFLDALGTERIPDPTTAGDFCRRFAETDVHALMQAIDDARLNVWARQPKKFFDRATIDMDGTLVITTGECKQGMDISYKGTWGYHPLVVSLAETGEVLRLVNRSGNRPSHEGAAEEANEAIAVCRKAGFRQIVLRGDTAFSQSARLDAWDRDGVTFYFGFKAMPNLEEIADSLPKNAWRKVLHEGFLAGAPIPAMKLVAPGDLPSDEELLAAAKQKPTDGLEVVFRADPSIGDGRQANNGWLQELPDPMTKLVWDNPALVGPSDAKAIGVKSGDHVKITVGDRDMTVPVWVQPGLPKGAITLFPGNGRPKGGRVAEGSGFDLYPLRTTKGMAFAAATVTKVKGKTKLACTIRSRERKPPAVGRRKNPSNTPSANPACTVGTRKLVFAAGLDAPWWSGRATSASPARMLSAGRRLVPRRRPRAPGLPGTSDPRPARSPT